MKLRSRIFISIFIIIFVFGAASVILGFTLIQQDIVNRSQEEVRRDLESMRLYYDGKINQLEKSLSLVVKNGIVNPDPQMIGADYLTTVSRSDKVESLVVNRAFTGAQSSGSSIVRREELQRLGKSLAERISIPIIETPKARPTQKTMIEEALVVECAMPVEWENGLVKKVIYAGKIINNDYNLISEIHSFVYENSIYGNKPVGTVTVFLDDVRIATNVLDETGKNAVGTRVSDVVYKKVIEEGQVFQARAFVVTDWYLTAYEPIVDTSGKRIGILYVGRLEKPFIDMVVRFFLIFSALLLCMVVLGALLTFILASTISRPVIEMNQTAQRIALGHYAQRISGISKIQEIHSLADTFNNMMHELENRENSLHAKSEEISALNRSYLDLISFVSHELKGILSSTILNAYTVRDGFLGMVNFKQRKALDSITRNLDHLAETVKNFLNLSRIEKGELDIRKAVCRLNEDVFSATLQAFEKMIGESEITVTNEIPDNILLEADRDMLFVVANNLVGNAIKYGSTPGRIILRSRIEPSRIEIEVYNDGDPLSRDDTDRLFQKFVRLGHTKKRHVKGTGLGLFITKIIIESHGGTITCVPGEAGNAFIISIPRGEYEESA
ncbi:MAG: cache domain-containing protein [Spirochaetales bacterium]|nr:cache domain-containing protein [Spirochaetales bacterium]